MVFAVSLLDRTKNVNVLSVLRGSGAGGAEQVEGVDHDNRGRAVNRERQKAACILLSRKGSGEPGAEAERVGLKPLHPQLPTPHHNHRRQKQEGQGKRAMLQKQAENQQGALRQTDHGLPLTHGLPPIHGLPPTQFLRKNTVAGKMDIRSLRVPMQRWGPLAEGPREMRPVVTEDGRRTHLQSQPT